MRGAFGAVVVSARAIVSAIVAGFLITAVLVALQPVRAAGAASTPGTPGTRNTPVGARAFPDISTIQVGGATALVSALTWDGDGQSRRWTLVQPVLISAGPIDLVIALHGVGHTGDEMRWIGLEDRAVAAGMAVAYPDGVDGAWNDGRPGTEPLSQSRPVDDVAFLRAVIAGSARSMGRDIASVAVVGFSNGAMMAARVACDMSDVVSVVALVSGSAGEGFQAGCHPLIPVSVAVVAARRDPVVPYSGGQVASFLGHARGRVSGADATVAFWRSMDECATSAEAPIVPASGVSGLRADGCESARHVVRYAIDDALHDWNHPAFDTTKVVWSFVQSELPRPPGLVAAVRAAMGMLD